MLESGVPNLLQLALCSVAPPLTLLKSQDGQVLLDTSNPPKHQVLLAYTTWAHVVRQPTAAHSSAWVPLQVQGAGDMATCAGI